MTEAEWLGCDDLAGMLDVVDGRMTDRKRRLFGVACCRRVAHLPTIDRADRPVVVAERYADGAATFDEKRASPTIARTAAGVAISWTWRNICSTRSRGPGARPSQA